MKEKIIEKIEKYYHNILNIQFNVRDLHFFELIIKKTKEEIFEDVFNNNNYDASVAVWVITEDVYLELKKKHLKDAYPN